jgi:L-threonylcarbamoyladenylate synthase
VTASVTTRVTVTPAELDAAADWLAEGGVVALPTETVYGLGADATSSAAVAAIFRLKGRPADHPLIVHVPAGADLTRFVTAVPPVAARLMAAFWPGPLTLILPRTAAIPPAVTGGQPTVGLRCPDHPVAQALLARFATVGSGVVAAPSANRFGHVSPTTAAHVRDEFGAAVGTEIRLLDGGPCRVGIESTIVDVSGAEPVLLRPGSIGLAALAAVAGVPVLPAAAARGDLPRAPGQLAAHYAPRTPLRLVPAGSLAGAVAAAARPLAVLALAPDPALPGVAWQRAPADAAGYAHDLYANLRALDARGARTILVERPPAGADWDAVHDRLGRAQAGSGDGAT